MYLNYPSKASKLIKFHTFLKLIISIKQGLCFPKFGKQCNDLFQHFASWMIVLEVSALKKEMLTVPLS